MRNDILKVIIVVLLITGCTKNEESTNYVEYDGNYSLIANIESCSPTRTMFDNSKKIVWMENDKLGIYGNKTSNSLFSTIRFQENSMSTEFVGKLSEPDKDIKWAYYPYDKSAETNEEIETLLFHLPIEYTYTGNIYAPMLGKKNANGKILFKHLCGLLYVTLKNLPTDAHEFVIRSVGDNAPYIAGKAFVPNINKADATLLIQNEGERMITYHLGSSETNGDTRTFLIPLPVGNYPELEISILKVDGSDYFTRSLGQQIVRRATIVEIPILDINTGQSFILQKNTKEITEEMESFITISSINQNTGIAMLTYTGVDESNIPKEGDVLLKPGMSDKFPRGFLGKVISVKKSGNNFHLKTGPTALDEAFSQLYVNETVDLVPEGSSVTRAQDNDGFVCFTIPLELKNGNAITVSGSCTMGIKFTPFIDIENKMMSYTIQDKVEVTGKIGVSGKLEGDIIQQELKKFKLPPFQVGPLVITPELQPSLVFRSTGEIEIMADVNFKHINVGGVECKDGQWSGGRRPLAPNSLSPWDLGGDFTFKGSLFSGISTSLNASLYHLNDLFNMGFDVKFGPEISGELDLAKLMTVTEKEELLSAASLKTRFVLSGDFNITANILSWQAQSSFPLVEVPFGETTLHVIPQVQKPNATVTQKEESGYKAQVKTRISEQLLTKKTIIKLALADKNGEILECGNSQEYRGEPKGTETPEVELNESFTNLENDKEYHSYPIVESPLVGNTGLELKSKNVSFKTGGNTLREQLIKLYNDTDGKNWKNNKNWCSEEPIETWYGVRKKDNGKYLLELIDNNLHGNVSLSHEDVVSVNLILNNITSLSLVECVNLSFFKVFGNPLEKLQVIGCKKITEECSYSSNYLKMIDISNSNYIIEDLDRCNKLKTFRAQNCTNLVDLILPMSELDTLDLNGCTNIKDIDAYCGYNIYETLRYLDLSKCNSLPKGYLNHVFINNTEDIPLEYMDISNCINEEGLAYSFFENDHGHMLGLPRNLKELYANNCQSLHYLTFSYFGSSLQKIEIKDCRNLKMLCCPNAQLTMLNLEGCNNINSLIISNNQLSSVNLEPCAENLITLKLDNNKINNINLSKCYNLKELQCESNPISKLDLSRCVKLELLNCSETLITMINIAPCKLLHTLNVSNCRIKELVSINCTALRYLNCSRNFLTNLNINGCTNIENMNCSDNLLKELHLTDCLKLQTLQCSNNNLIEIDLSNHQFLKEIDCSNNLQLLLLNLSRCENLNRVVFFNISNPNLEMDISECNNLEEEWIERNIVNGYKFKSLNMSNLKNIKKLSVNGPLSVNFSGCTSLEDVHLKVESADFTDCIQLKNLYCTASDLHELILKGCVNLHDLQCMNVKLASLDVSDCTALETLNCGFNMSLVELILPTSKKFYTSFYCWETRITKEIPNWFPDNLLPQTYFQRYSYTGGKYGEEIKVIDNGYGWWYPGEPEKKRHSRY